VETARTHGTDFEEMAPIDQIVAAHPGLVAKLRRFSHPQAMRLAAALGLFPEIHAQTIRVEILQHLVATCCAGQREPERDDLAEWAGKYMADSPFTRHEDPVEDVFVGSINSPFGSFRLLMGIFADADFWLERLLVFLSDKQNFPPFEAAVTRVLPLLKLSDALVGRIGLKRYTEGGGSRAIKIQVPRWRELKLRVEALFFSDADLVRCRLERSELREFVLTEEHRAKLIGEDLWDSTLERRPLMEQPEGISIIMPTSLGRSAQRFIVESIAKSGMGGWADQFYQVETASVFISEVASRLGITRMDFQPPSPPDGLPPLFPFFGQFDVGKPAILLTYCPSLIGATANFGGHDCLTNEEEKAFEAYLRACACELEKLPGFSGGLILVSAAGGARTTFFTANEWSPHWRIHACSLPDWLHITFGGQCGAMRLWKLGDHQAVLSRSGTEMLNLAGLANLFAAWKSNGFRILPRSQDPRGLTMLNLDCAFGVDLRVETRQQEDAHCLRSHDRKRWVRVVRHNAQPLFAEDAHAGLYISPLALKEGSLVGCLEHVSGVWWVVMPSVEASGELKSVAFQLWECVLSWTERVAPIAEREWSVLGTNQSVEVVLNLPNFAKWRIEDHPTNPLLSAQLSVSVDLKQTRVTITLPEEFLNEFHTPKNTAEQRIVDCLLGGAAKLGGVDPDESRRKELVREIVRTEDARHFHLIKVRRVEQLFAGPERPRPLFVTEEDGAFSQLGLAYIVGQTQGGTEMSGLAVCRDFLGDAVTKVWERIESRLKVFNRISVLMGCFHELDEIARDEECWDITARSQFALHSDRANVHNVLHEQRSEREKAALCNRLLIETAQYACGVEQRIFTQADYLTLVADMALLIMLAHHRDVISFGFIDPKVRILPNGEIEIDERFYKDILGRYLTKRSHKQSEDAAENYDDYFPSAAETKALDNVIAELDQVFIPEFGFSANLLSKLLDEFREFVFHNGSLRGALDETQMHALLNRCGFLRAQGEEFLNRFTLPIRSAWNADLPSQCGQHDVYPWRFRRQLSLLNRPLVQVGISPKSWVVSVPTLMKSISYCLGHIERGYLPKEFFRSPEMHRYIGKIANQRGHEFTHLVGNRVSAHGYRADTEVEMARLGASKKEGLGDIDVFAWDAASGRVLAIECKRLLPAVTVREVIQRLEDFRGNRQEKDSLGRHLRRVDWLTKHMEVIVKYTNIPLGKIRLIPLLVTSETVPMQFFSEMNFPTSQVVPYEELKSYMRHMASG
jgi:hypothetical protein